MVAGLPIMRMGGSMTASGAEMASTASFCLGFSFGSERGDKRCITEPLYEIVSRVNNIVVK